MKIYTHMLNDIATETMPNKNEWPITRAFAKVMNGIYQLLTTDLKSRLGGVLVPSRLIIICQDPGFWYNPRQHVAVF